MPNDHSRNRLYSEQEVGALIQRATELHESKTGIPDRGLSLAEVERIATELGVPRDHIRRAALELELEDRPRSSKQFSLFGGPFVINESRLVDRPVQQEQWVRAVMRIREANGKKGELDEMGAAREWRHAVGEGDQGFNFVGTQISVVPENDTTTIRLRKHYGGGAVSAYVSAFLLLLFMVFFILNDPGAEPVIGIGLGLGALALVRISISLWAKRQREKVSRLADDLVQIMSTPAGIAESHAPIDRTIDIAATEEPADNPQRNRSRLRD